MSKPESHYLMARLLRRRSLALLSFGWKMIVAIQIAHHATDSVFRRSAGLTRH